MRPNAIPPSASNSGAFTPASTGLPVLDAEAAMALMDNSTELYLDIANAYVLELDQLTAKAEADLNAADLPQAARTLHTFKGLSLTLGAKHMSEVCRQCELRLKSLAQAKQTLPDGDRVHMIGAVREGASLTLQAMEQAISTLAQPLPEQQETAAGAPQSDALADLHALKLLLSKSDLQALDCFAALRTRHRALHGELSALEKALNTFDFSQAVVQCDEMIRRIGSTK